MISRHSFVYVSCLCQFRAVLSLSPALCLHSTPYFVVTPLRHPRARARFFVVMQLGWKSRSVFVRSARVAKRFYLHDRPAKPAENFLTQYSFFFTHVSSHTKRHGHFCRFCYSCFRRLWYHVYQHRCRRYDCLFWNRCPWVSTFQQKNVNEILNETSGR